MDCSHYEVTVRLSDPPDTPWIVAFRHDDPMDQTVFERHVDECLAEAADPRETAPARLGESVTEAFRRRFIDAMGDLDYTPLGWQGRLIRSIPVSSPTP
jgi:hypothetical protein